MQESHTLEAEVLSPAISTISQEVCSQEDLPHALTIELTAALQFHLNAKEHLTQILRCLRVPLGLTERRTAGKKDSKVQCVASHVTCPIMHRHSNTCQCEQRVNCPSQN
jgi:hypothetical protein